MEFHTGWDKDKQKQFSYIKQDGATVKSKYTKDEPNGMPPMEKKKLKGQEVWDDSDQLDFLDEMLKKDVLPQLRKSGETIIPDQEDLPITEVHEEIDPLPF